MPEAHHSSDPQPGGRGRFADRISEGRLQSNRRLAAGPPLAIPCMPFEQVGMPCCARPWRGSGRAQPARKACGGRPLQPKWDLAVERSSLSPLRRRPSHVPGVPARLRPAGRGGGGLLRALVAARDRQGRPGHPRRADRPQPVRLPRRRPARPPAARPGRHPRRHPRRPGLADGAGRRPAGHGRGLLLRPRLAGPDQRPLLPHPPRRHPLRRRRLGAACRGLHPGAARGAGPGGCWWSSTVATPRAWPPPRRRPSR
jgi:hypothetical protein